MLFQSLTGQFEENKPTLIDPISFLHKCQRIFGVTPLHGILDNDTRRFDFEYEAESADEEEHASESNCQSDYSSDSEGLDKTKSFVIDELLQKLCLQQTGNVRDTSTIYSSSISAANSSSNSRSSQRLLASNIYSHRNGTDQVKLDADGNIIKASHEEAWIRRVHVTSTRIFPNPPELELLNRFLRQFSKHRDRFIRVHFCDEHGRKIALKSTADILAHISSHDGIIVAGEKFVFLELSNSQLREGSCYFYNENPNPQTDTSPPPTAEEIRMWMGDFSKIRIPGK